MPVKVPAMAPMVFSTPAKVAPPKEMPTKQTPQKNEQTPSKKDLTPDTTSEPPVKKQRTSSLSSNWGNDSKHGDMSDNKKKKKKEKE